MDIWLDGFYAISEVFSQQEYNEYIKLLSWYDVKEEKYDKLYWEKINSKGNLTLITYSGLVKPLSEKINVNVINPKVTTRFDGKINRNIINDITLADFQSHCIYKSLTHKRGLIVAPTGAGKSYISIATILHLLEFNLVEKGIVIVPTTGLADQYYEDTVEAGCPKKMFGVVHGKKKQYGAQILICVINSINSGLKNFNEELIEHIKNSDFIITDEAHKISSNMYTDFYSLVNKRFEYNLFYTAEPFENHDPMKDYKDAIILGLAEKEIIRISNKYLIDIGFVAQPIVHIHDMGGNTKKFRSGFNRIYDTFIKKNKRRNEIAKNYIEYFASFNMRILVLVNKLDHARNMMELIPHLKSISVFGGSKGLERKEPNGSIEEIKVNYNDFRKRFEKNEWDVVFGSPTMDEGFNIKSIESVIMLGGMKAKRKLIQRIGRGARKKKYLNYVYIVDFYDRGHIFVCNHSKQRKQIYENHGSLLINNKSEFEKIITEHRNKLREITRDV